MMTQTQHKVSKLVYSYRNNVVDPLTQLERSCTALVGVEEREAPAQNAACLTASKHTRHRQQQSLTSVLHQCHSFIHHCPHPSLSDSNLPLPAVVQSVAYGIRSMAEDKKQLVCQPASLSVY